MATQYNGAAAWQRKFSLASFRALLDNADALVAAEVDHLEWSYNLVVKKPSATLTGDSLSGFDEEVDEATWRHLNFGTATCKGYPEAGPTSSSIWLQVQVGWPTDDNTRFNVAGDSRTEVEGIAAQLKELGDDLFESPGLPRIAEPEQAVLLAALPPIPPATPLAAVEPPVRSSRWWENTVVQGVALIAAILGIIGFVILLAH